MQILELIFLHSLHFCFIRIAPHSSEYMQNFHFFREYIYKEACMKVGIKFLNTLALWFKMGSL